MNRDQRDQPGTLLAGHGAVNSFHDELDRITRTARRLFGARVAQIIRKDVRTSGEKLRRRGAATTLNGCADGATVVRW